MLGRMMKDICCHGPRRITPPRKGRKEERGRQGVAYGIRECDDDDDAATFSCSLFQNRDLYAGQVLKFQALTRKLDFQRAWVSEYTKCDPDGSVNVVSWKTVGNPLKAQTSSTGRATETSLPWRNTEESTRCRSIDSFQSANPDSLSRL